MSVAKQRVDAARNRERLLAVAKDVFLEDGPSASLDRIAKQAGVGIGTLYRHFPNRAAIVEAMYRQAADGLSDAASQLAETRAPVEALREWLGLFVSYMATKRLVRAILEELETANPEMYASSGRQLKTAIAMLVERAVEAGEIRLEMEPIDLLRALVGLSDSEGTRDWEPSARRLIDVMIAGMCVRTQGQKPNKRKTKGAK